MPLKIEIQGLARMGGVGSEVGKAAERVKEMLARATNDFANDSVARIKRDYLTGPRPQKLGVVTGRLRSSIRFRIDSDGKLTTIRFGTDVPYARVHEEGGDPFDIVAKSAKALRFKGRDGNYIFRKKVRHPGMRARPFLRPGVDDALPGYQKAIEDGLQKIGNFSDGK
jgi:phage gpG-like protein